MVRRFAWMANPRYANQPEPRSDGKKTATTGQVQLGQKGVTSPLAPSGQTMAGARKRFSSSVGVTDCRVSASTAYA